jgi:hypothetical protein
MAKDSFCGSELFFVAFFSPRRALRRAGGISSPSFPIIPVLETLVSTPTAAEINRETPFCK